MQSSNLKNLNIEPNTNFGQILKNVNITMYGHLVGDEVRGTVFSNGRYEQAHAVVILEKKALVAGFAYLVARKDNRAHIWVAQTLNKPDVADVLCFNARVIGSDDPSLGVASMAEARREMWL